MRRRAQKCGTLRRTGTRGGEQKTLSCCPRLRLAQWPLKTENKRHCSALFRIDICEYNIDARRGYAAWRDLKRRLKIKETYVDARASARSNCAHVEHQRCFMTKINHVTVHYDDGEQRQRAYYTAFVLFFFASNW